LGLNFFYSPYLKQKLLQQKMIFYRITETCMIHTLDVFMQIEKQNIVENLQVSELNTL
tara:strand:- start:1004 stop:1177 length:174 start_codon:yes stop_codon:yes gene_type:complete